MNYCPVGLRVVALLLVLLVIYPDAALATKGNSEKIRLEASDAPDPFAPPAQVSKLTCVAYLSKVAGLGNFDREDEGDCDEDRRGGRGDSKTFEVEVEWLIKRGNQLVRKISKSVEVQPPLELVRLPGSGGRSKKFVRLPLELVWDGRVAFGRLADGGAYSWEAEASFIRTHHHRDRDHDKLIDSSESIRGTVTVNRDTPAPTITITQPANGAITKLSTVAVAGSITGEVPLTVKINGAASAVGVATFAGSASLVADGTHPIVAVVTDVRGRSAQASVTVVRDSVPPAIQVSAPPSGSSTSNALPVFLVRYSDPVPGTGVDTSTFSYQLDGANLSASHTLGPDQAVVTLVAPISPGQHTFQAAISDRAGNSGAATSTFTVLDGKPPAPSVSRYPQTTNVPEIRLSGGKAPNTAILVGGIERAPLSASTTWSITKTLLEGLNILQVQARSSSGQVSDATTVSVTLDSIPPAPPTLETPPTDVTTPVVTLSGTKPPGTAIVVNGVVVVPANNQTDWTAAVNLSPGDNHFTVETQDTAGNRSITPSGEVAGVVHSKPVIGGLAVSPATLPTGQSATISYKLFALTPPTANADLRVAVTIEDGDQSIRTAFTGIQQGSPAGSSYSVTWDGKDDQGRPVAINTSYRIVVSADRVSPTTQAADLVNANPKDAAITVIGSQQVTSADGKLAVVFRPDDAILKVTPQAALSSQQAVVIARRVIHAVGKPYRITVDRSFTSPVAGVFKCQRPAGRHFRPFKWDESQQDWRPIARSYWNPADQTLRFPIDGQGLVLIGTTADFAPPQVTRLTTPPGKTAIRIRDIDSGINTQRTRLKCQGVDITASLVTQNINGVKELLVTTANPNARSADLLLYLEDWAGNGKLHRLKGGGQ